MESRNPYGIRIFRQILVISFTSSFLALLVSGCSLYLVDVAEKAPQPPSLANAAPRLTKLVATPSILRRGYSNEISVRLSFEDWNEDVGPSQVRLRRTIRKLEGNFELTNPVREYWVSSIDSLGREGNLNFQLTISLDYNISGSIELLVSIYDNSGNLSTPISQILKIQ